MRTITWLRRAGWLGVLGTALLTSRSLWADDGPPAGSKPSADKDKDKEQKETYEDKMRRKGYIVGPRSKYWLGVEIAPIPPALKDQLELKGEGILIREVAPESPAEKAGVKVNDILLSVADMPIKRQSDLTEAVEQSEGKALEFKFIHAGKPTSATITPAERPEGRGSRGTGYRDIDRAELEAMVRERIKRAEGYARAKGEAAELEVMEKAKRVEAEVLEKLKRAGVDLRMEFVERGQVFPPGKGSVFMFSKAELPDDLSVTIRKQGKNPTEIDVKQGEQTWSVKENELDKLPEDLRKHLQGMLGGVPIRWNVVRDTPKVPTGSGYGAPASPYSPKPPAAPKGVAPPQPRERAQSTVERRLKEMSGRLEQMQKQMEELKKSLHGEDKKTADDSDDGDSDNGDSEDSNLEGSTSEDGSS